jgi:hypothetical protein
MGDARSLIRNLNFAPKVHTHDHGTNTGLADDDHPQYTKHALATAANDFLVASGAGVFVKKTLAETQALIGSGSGWNIDGGAPDTVYSQTSPMDGGTP